MVPPQELKVIEDNTSLPHVALTSLTHEACPLPTHGVSPSACWMPENGEKR